MEDIELGQLWVVAVPTEGNGGEEIAGFAAITTHQPDEYAQAGWDTSELCVVAHRLCSSPRHRGKGVALMLYRQCEEVARARGLRKLRVDTNCENGPMNAVIVKSGYSLAGTCRLIVDGPGADKGLVFNCYERHLPEI